MAERRQLLDFPKDIEQFEAVEYFKDEKWLKRPYEEWGEYLRKEASEGVTFFQWATEFEEKKLSKRWKEQAVKYYLLAAQKGIKKEGLARLDKMIKKKLVHLSEWQTVVYYILKMSEDRPGALYEAAQRFERGDGVAQSKEKAAYYYLLAAKRGYRGEDIWKKLDVILSEKSDEEVASHYLTAIEYGSQVALLRLGKMYEEGRARLEDDQVLNYYLAMAEKGDANAMYEVASRYEKKLETGIEDPQESTRLSNIMLQYYHSASKQGHPEALFTLGRMYLCGKHVQKSNQKGAFFLECAADKKHTKALLELGKIHENGFRRCNCNKGAKRPSKEVLCVSNSRRDSFPANP